MGDRFTGNCIITCFTSRGYPCGRLNSSDSLLLAAAFLIDLFPKGHDTPLSPSHAGDEGFFNHHVCTIAGLRPVDMVVLPRPSVKEEGKAAMSVPSKGIYEKTEVELVLMV